MKKAAPCCNYATHSDNATARPLLLLYRGNSLPCDNTAAVGSLPFEIGSRGQSFPQSKCVVAVKITAASKGIKGQEKRNENVNVMIGRTEESDPSEGSLRSFWSVGKSQRSLALSIIAMRIFVYWRLLIY
ncbi:hypothetical protein DINM_002256 [Dirofilaria immitis]|nr:hypothetical protein [Dirofilaria immitis]